jgi:hypothetical protein
MTAKAELVLRKIISLRELEKTTGVRSPRTQRNLLLTLEDSELADVSLELAILSSALCRGAQ